MSNSIREDIIVHSPNPSTEEFEELIKLLGALPKCTIKYTKHDFKIWPNYRLAFSGLRETSTITKSNPTHTLAELRPKVIIW